jgi:multiple sugar transport system ATP-binding protein
MAKVALKNIWKKIGAASIVKGVNLNLNDGEFVVMVGPSGCGKSTLLRMIAGLEEVSDGSIHIGEEDVTLSPPGNRGVSMVFQDYALYPHMSVFENLAFGLRLKKLSEEEIQERVGEAARMLGLKDYLNRKPKELSGGQRQRVAMGRAVVKNAKLFLFDEPLSNLDAKLRGVMRGEIKRFHKQNKVTTLYVTHDQLEAMTLADRLVVINMGVIEQEGHPLEVFDNPRNLFVARFIGAPEINIIEVEVIQENEKLFLYRPELNMRFPVPQNKVEKLRGHQKVLLGLRPSDVYIAQDDQLGHWTLKAEVEMVEVLGKNAYINFSLAEGTSCSGEVMGRSLPEIGDSAWVVFNLEHAHFFDKKTGLNLF